MERRINGCDLIRKEADKEFSELFSGFMTVNEAKEGKYDDLPYGDFYDTDKDSYDKALKTDLNNICKVIPDILYKTVLVNVRHCCTPEGDGFYTISSGDNIKYIQSAFKLEQVGGAWSYIVWRSLFFAQALLSKYLEDLRDNILKKYPVCKMEIRPLYLPWINASIEDKDELFNKSFFDYNDKEAVFNYRDTFLKDNRQYLEEYRSSGLPWYLWYNGEEGELYFRADNIIHRCVSDLYKDEKEYKKVGLWPQIRKMIDVLNNMKYHRDGFERQED